jgi:flagella basal body P-ring formation protein FlgA
MIRLVALFAACLPVQSDRITAADVARAVPEFSRIAAGQVISYSPIPGLVRVFTPAELGQWLSRQNITHGATEPVCFEWTMRTVTAEEIRSAMLSSLPAGSDIVVSSHPERALPEGNLQFPLRGIANGNTDERDWHGYVEYAPGKRIPVTARVVFRVPFTRVVPKEPLRAGQRITADHVRAESGTGVPQREGFATSIAEVAGRMATRFLPAGKDIPFTALSDPAAVSRGDALQVEVRSGNAKLRFEGLAQGSGAAGALVPVRMLDSGRIVHARVASDGRAVLDLTSPEEKR